ncbi:MAG: hypothetical protein ACRENO_01565, partial [Thermodesulfobacteriota bacterium]
EIKGEQSTSVDKIPETKTAREVVEKEQFNNSDNKTRKSKKEKKIHVDRGSNKNTSTKETATYIFKDINISRVWFSDIYKGTVEITSERLIIDNSEIIKRDSIVSISMRKHQQDWISIRYKVMNAFVVVHLCAEEEIENNKIKSAIMTILKLHIRDQEEVSGKKQNNIHGGKNKADKEKVLLEIDEVQYSYDREKHSHEGKLYVRRNSLEFKNPLYPPETEFKIDKIADIQYIPSGGDVYSNYIEVIFHLDEDIESIRVIYLTKYSLWGGSPTLNIFNSIQELIIKGQFVLY